MSATAGDLFAAVAGGDEARAEAAVQAVSALPPEASRELFERLADAAASADEDRRWWAVRALAALAHVDPLAQLISALQDGSPAVRQCAALGLRARADARGVTALAAAHADPDPLTARLAGDALVAAGGAAVPVLLETVERGAHPARLAALRALAAIGDPRSIPALFAALDGSALEEYWASEGLERMGGGMSFFNPG